MAEDPTPAAPRSDPPESGSGAESASKRRDQPCIDVKRWGELVLLEEIGRGSFGTVYRAHDPQLDRAVALKLLPSSGDDQLASRLLNEARTLARVRHPNVVTVYGAGEHGGQVGLWMEFIRGVTLEQMLAIHGPFSDGEAGLIGRDLCRALATVHRAGLIHGDVKAENVMREQGGRLVLMDFGASRSSADPLRGAIAGTVAYLAPELLEGAPATIASDVYSVGVFLYHLVTNDFPVKADTIAGLRAAHLRGDAARLQDLRPELHETFVRVVERATEREPGRRFASVSEMETALARIHGVSTADGSLPAYPLVSGRRAPVAVGAPPAFPEPGDTLGHYQIVEQIGAGGSGVVYRATDMRLKREVAIKVLRETFGTDPERLALFTQEAQAVASLSHPNILTLHDVGTDRGLWYAVTELVHGQTLRARLARAPLPVDEAIGFAIEVTHGLAAAHSKNIVHMDLKPENLMVTDEGWLKILDFGIAKVGRSADAGDTDTTRTERPDRGWGTLAYMSPEQVSGDHIDCRSDLFSLGIILYEMLAGRHPFKRESPAATMGAILRDDPAPVPAMNPAVSPALDRIIRRSLKKPPDERFQSAREIRFALEAARDAGPRSETAPVASIGVRGDLSSVAVLPFTDMSPARDQECFCDGIAEELLNALTQIPGLRVAARTSAFQFKGQARDARHIGQVLNVATVLDGSVRKHNNRLRITVELVGTGDGYQLWSERFDRELEDVFAVQDEIAASIVKTLKGQLTTRVALVAPHTRDLDAYTFYLEGRYHWNKRTEDELERSVGCFERAIERDPGYAVAYAGMADAYVTLGTYSTRPPADVMPKAKKALERALDIDPDLAEAYACRGCVRSVFDWSWADAERDFLRAIALNPSYATAHHWYAINHLVPRGRFDEAGDELHRALGLDPLSLAIRTSLGMKSYFAARYDHAVDELLRTIQLDHQFGMAHAFLGATYTEQGLYDKALTEIEVALRLCGRMPEILASLGYLLGRSGDAAQARAVLNELTRASAERYVSPARLAHVHVGLNNREEVLDRLEAAAAERAADLAWLGVRPVFAAFRDEPRVVSLLKQMRLVAPGAGNQL